MKRMKGIVIGAVLAAGMLIGVPTYMSSQAVHTTVTVDINPSVALSLNKNDKVVKVEAINEDAKSLELQKLKGLSIEEAAERLIDQAEDKGFISDDDDAVILITAVDAKPKSGPEAQAVLEKISKDVQQGTVLEKVDIALQVADQETLERALKEAMPLGLITLDDTVESGTKVMDFVRDENNRVLLENNVLLLTEDELDLDDADDDSDDADDDSDDADDDSDDADDDSDDADDDSDDADDDSDDADDDSDDADDDSDDADDDSDDADDDSDDADDDSDDADDDLDDADDDLDDADDDSDDADDDLDDVDDDLDDADDDSDDADDDSDDADDDSDDADDDSDDDNA